MTVCSQKYALEEAEERGGGGGFEDEDEQREQIESRLQIKKEVNMAQHMGVRILIVFLKSILSLLPFCFHFYGCYLCPFLFLYLFHHSSSVLYCCS